MKLSTHKFSKIKYIDFHTHQADASPQTAQVISTEVSDLQNMALENVDGSFLSVGMHPWRLPPNTDNLKQDMRSLRKTLKIPEVLAIGEVGLDRIWGPDLDIQKRYLNEIFKIAETYRKPLIIHCVRCYPELIAIRKKYSPGLKLLVHGCNAKVRILEELFFHGFYVSLDSAALKRDDICGFIHRKPESFHRLCLETDDSDTTIESIYKQAAQVFEMELEELTRFMKTNFISLFQGK